MTTSDATKKLSLLLAAAAVVGISTGFAPPPGSGGIGPSPPAPSRALGELASVDDYFASFGADGGGGAGEGPPEEGAPAGRGRMTAHGAASQGGMFDVQNYFGSFSDDDGGEGPPAPPFPDGPPADDGGGATRPREGMTYGEMVAYNDARLCPKLFLTQRAIQSFGCLLEACRDPHSGKWIEDFLGLPNLMNYHGTGAINVTAHPTWDAPLTDLMSQPNTKVVVSAKRRGRGHGGWSRNNPYLQERWVEFEIDVRPASLVQRLLPLRAQLAKEFEGDLDAVGAAGGMIMDSYFRKLRDGGAPSFGGDEAFDRMSAGILANLTEFQEGGSSPFRRGNFDLLYGLCTQTAAHRLLRELRSTSSEPNGEIVYEFFKQFYVAQVSSHFDGDQAFGRADDFVDALLRTPPSLVETPGGRTAGLTDPLLMAERIIGLRGEIALEWKGLMGEVGEDHRRLTRDVLRQTVMERTLDESEDIGQGGVVLEEEVTVEELADSTGAFE